MPVPANDKQEIIDSVLGQVTRKTKVIAIPHIISVYGTVMPIAEICDFARKNGIFTVIDGAQAVGQINVDQKSLKMMHTILVFISGYYHLLEMEFCT